MCFFEEIEKVSLSSVLFLFKESKGLQSRHKES
jgi:hypothetical protein